MGSQNNLSGRVVSWGGTTNTQLISTGGAPLATFDFSMDAPSLSYLPHDSTGAMSAVAGLASWTATLNMLLKAPQIGNNGFITFADGYVLNAKGFSIDISAGAIDSTAFNSTAPTYRSFIPGAYGWRGNWNGDLDSATVVSAVGAAGAAAAGTAAVFQYGASGAAGVKLSGNIIPDSFGLQLADNAANSYNYGFTGDGALASPNSAHGILSTGASLIVPVMSTLVLSAGDGTRVSGLAFWKGISVKAAVADFVSVTVQVQGSGDPGLS